MAGAMNFFERQAAARRASNRLVLLFALAVIGIIAAVCVAAAAVVGPDPGVLAAAALATLLVIGLGSLFRITTLRDGGSAVAQQMGGTPVPADTTDLDLRRLRNVVEEVAIASGVPMPQLFVLEKEAGINAFAAGYAPADAAVAVTRGALDRLNRDELQGVVAHEFSHVLNGDMRLNIRLVGVLFGILMLSTIGRKVLQLGGRSRERGAAAVVVAALVAMVIGAIGLFFGRMIKAGISRSREMLADASAVQFTRQPQGLAGALKKIAGVQEGSRLNERADAEEVSHMLFGDGVGLRGMFATHPPLLQRIQALEPGFDDARLQQLRRQWLDVPPSGLAEDRLLGLDQVSVEPLPASDGTLQVTPPMVSGQVANPATDDYRRAGRLHAGLGPALRALARERDQAMPLLLALLLDAAAGTRSRQDSEIRARLGEDVLARVHELADGPLRELHPLLRLPLAELAFPVLRLRPRPELETFLDTVDAVIHTDAEVSLFEYCLGMLLQVQVRESLDPRRFARFGRRRLRDASDAAATLLAVVADVGHPHDAAAARRAYLAGMQRLLPDLHLPYATPAERLRALDQAWPVLDALDPFAKQLLVEAITVAIGHDGRINVAEAELLRTICGVLHCPLPPVLES
ncbi:MAG: M48 family metalloprotease [Pseudoxanthomonas suwonensis]|nr:M48 family metalloprotease [Pseudoxanthomonas suwonensis]